jgi:hypothetical protein
MATNKRGCITEICILLLVAFIVLKLTKVITWSWWWVLSPAWIWVGLWLIVIVLAFIGAIVSDN